jgi:hypothetical protein
MRTNKTITIIRETVNWKHQKTTTSLGSYDVWLEEVVVRSLTHREGHTVSEKLGDGLVFLANDVDLTNCYWMSGSTRHDFVDWDRFYARDGAFHHVEAIYV